MSICSSRRTTGGRASGSLSITQRATAQEERHIFGNITARKLVRNLPDAFLSDPETPPAIVSSLIGLDGDGCELYEITVETIGYFSRALGDFVNPRIPPQPGDPVFLASSETLSRRALPATRGRCRARRTSGVC